MKQQNLNITENATKAHKHSHFKHMWMMAVCCGLPIVGFLTIGALDINVPSLETLIVLICPIGMIGMLFMMNRNRQRKGKGHSCCQQEETEAKPQDNIVSTEKQAEALNPIQAEHAGSFKA